MDYLFLKIKSFNILNSHLFCSYYIMSSLLKQFGLVIEYKKMKVFHFSRSHGVFNPPLLNLTTLGGPILHFKETQHYLGFIFDRKLTFQQHINFYANKTILTAKCMKMIGNSSRGLIPTQKCLLYRTCILLITLRNTKIGLYFIFLLFSIPPSLFYFQKYGQGSVVCHRLLSHCHMIMCHDGKQQKILEEVMLYYRLYIWWP